MRKCRVTNTHVPRWSKMTSKRFWSLKSKIEANSRFHKELGRASDLNQSLLPRERLRWTWNGSFDQMIIWWMGYTMRFTWSRGRHFSAGRVLQVPETQLSVWTGSAGRKLGVTRHGTTLRRHVQRYDILVPIFLCSCIALPNNTNYRKTWHAPSFLSSLAVEIKMLLNEARINSLNSRSTLVEKTVGHGWPIFTLHWSRCTEIQFFCKIHHNF